MASSGNYNKALIRSTRSRAELVELARPAKKPRKEWPIGAPQIHFSSNPLVNTLANVGVQKAIEYREPIVAGLKSAAATARDWFVAKPEPIAKPTDRRAFTTSRFDLPSQRNYLDPTRRPFQRTNTPSIATSGPSRYNRDNRSNQRYDSSSYARNQLPSSSNGGNRKPPTTRRSRTSRSNMPKRPRGTRLGAVAATRGFAPQYGSRGIPVEKKVIGTNVQHTGLVNTGVITLINGVAQGDDFNQREGRQITVKSVQVRGFFDRIALTDQQAAHCRLLVLMDQQANGAAPTMADILEQATEPLSFMNLNNRERFKVLADVQTILGLQDATNGWSTTTQGDNAYFDIWKPVSFNTTFGGTGATAASIQKNAIYVVVMSDDVVNTISRCNWTARVRFTDA